MKYSAVRALIDEANATTEAYQLNIGLHNGGSFFKHDYCRHNEPGHVLVVQPPPYDSTAGFIQIDLDAIAWLQVVDLS